MSESPDQIAKTIRQLRKDCSMTQVELAVALGVAPTSIHRWEAGTSSPEFEVVVSLWALAIEHGSATSRHLAEFLSSRTEAIRPLFDAAQLPAIKALDKEIASLAADQRQLVRALIDMLKEGNDNTADRVVRAVLEPWRSRLSEAQRAQRFTKTEKPGRTSSLRHNRN